MLNKTAFKKMRERFERFDKQREEVIAQSRSILKSSKAAIYAAHREDFQTAHKRHAQASKDLKKLNTLVRKDIHLASVGAYTDALEEYAEAACFVHYLTHGTIPTADHLGIDADIYIPALADVVGELVRYAINSAIRGNRDVPFAVRDFVSELYAELLLFDFRNSPARRKFDSIKYGLEKLEDLTLKLKFS